MKKLQFVIIDDDLVIREVLKILAYKISKTYGAKAEILTAESGVEGLGLVIAVQPDITIIDTTLPKYSGRELLEYLITNTRFKKDGLVALNDGFFDYRAKGLLDKRSTFFIEKVSELLREKVERVLDVKGEKKEMSSFMSTLLLWTFHLANHSDLVMRIRENSYFLKKFVLFIYWFMLQLFMSFLLVLLRFSTEKIEEGHIEQKRADLKMYRVRYYPTVATIMVAALITVLQVGLFIVGGVTILNSRVDSLFAMAAYEQGFEFNTSTSESYRYDNDVIQFTESGVQLRSQIPEEEPAPAPEEPPAEEPPVEEPPVEEPPVEEPPVEEPPVEEPPVEEPPVEEPPVEEPPVEEPPVEEPAPEGGEEPSEPQVLGAETTELEPAPVQASSKYAIDKPSIVTKNPVTYTELKEIIERSSLNSDDSSVQSVETFTNNADANITYQLSPDGDNWFYYSAGDDAWSKTQQEWVSSNTVQEINANIGKYSELFPTGELYMKIFMHSGGNTQVQLHEIVVQRDSSALTPLVTELPEPEAPEEEVITKIDFEKMEPVIFNAAYFQGEKVVKGKLLSKNKEAITKYEITQEDLDQYEARIFFANPTSGQKLDLIGVTELYIDSAGEIEFLLRAPAKRGGFVTAEIVLKAAEDTKSEPADPLKD